MIDFIILHGTLFLLIYLVSSVIGYFAIDLALKSEKLKNSIPHYYTGRQQKKIKMLIKIILLVFVHIPVINTLYALIFIYFFIKGFLYNK